MIAEPIEPAGPVVPGLSGIPETMLWTLYGRASQAMRPDSVLDDPDCVRIYRSIDYAFERHFGSPNVLFAVRAAAIDRALRRWLQHHPSGCIVSLGEGLETQALRVDNGRMHWLTVDLPEAIRVRERFLPPTDRFRHLAMSALDPAWMDAVNASCGVFVVAQGLFMYLDAAEVRETLRMVTARFPGVELVFDVAPRALSVATLQRKGQTPDYVLPVMPWGLDRTEVRPVLRQWCPQLTAIRRLRYRESGRRPQLVEDLLDLLVRRRRKLQCLVHART
ncbi:MAG TPA: class I SAM-dependent methyltransferase [Rhodanobacter sp.]|nr:class I SAM-dependent methyltransferase [Rhodanobacter sp.]